MKKEVKERSSNTLASQPKPAMILPKTVEQARLTYLERLGLVSDPKDIGLLFLANQASVAFGELVVAPEDSLTGTVEKHACKQREAGDEGRSCFGLPKDLWRKRELVVEQVAQVEEAKHPSSGCREERLFGKKYVRRKKRKEHMDSTSTLDLVQKSSSQRERGIYNNAETHSKSEQIVEAVDGQEGRCKGDDSQEITPRSLIPHIYGIKYQEIPKRQSSQRKRKPRELKKNWGSISLSETRLGKEPVVNDAADSETEAKEDNEAENTISEAALNQAVLGSDIFLDEEIVISESEGFIPLLLEEAKEKEKGISNASRCNQLWNFKTRPRTSRGIRRPVQWSNKRKRNRMTFEETQRNRKILILAVEAITHQLGLLDVSMEEKSSYK